MEQRLSLITLGVEDLNSMRRFYEEVFRWEPASYSNENIVFFHLNGMQLALFGRQALAEDAHVDSSGQGFKGFSLACNMQSQKEVDQLFKELESSGARVVKPPAKTDWGGYSGYVADPEGNLWEIAYNPFMAFDESGNVLQDD